MILNIDFKLYIFITFHLIKYIISLKEFSLPKHKINNTNYTPSKYHKLVLKSSHLHTHRNVKTLTTFNFIFFLPLPTVYNHSLIMEIKSYIRVSLLKEKFRFSNSSANSFSDTFILNKNDLISIVVKIF